MEDLNVLQALSDALYERTRVRICTNHIHTDKEGWYYYIPARSLESKHPLILYHYRGAPFVAIPTFDFEEMVDDVISVEDYVNSSFWNYGYYWGGGSVLYGIFWQQLEDTTGIHDTEKIFRYLTILGCRTHQNSTGYRPSKERCEACELANCPFSTLESKKQNASWDNEVKEENNREKLFLAVRKRIEEQFGLIATCCFPHGWGDTICIELDEKTQKTGFVTVFLPQHLLLNLLYHPERYDVEEIAKTLNIQVRIPWHQDANGRLVNNQLISLTTELENPETIQKLLDTYFPAANKKPTLIEKIKRWFTRFVKR